MEAALEAAFHCGLWLNYAKSKLRHGEWLPWLVKLGLMKRTAQQYMALASKAHDRSLLLSARNLTHAMELAGVRKPDPITADEGDTSTKVRLPDTLETITAAFMRWKKNDFDQRIETASDILLCAYAEGLRPMADAYALVSERLRRK